MTDSTTLDVVYIPNHPYEWGWDAWVAVGTLVLAAATFAAVFVPLLIDRRQAKVREIELRKQAGYMAISFDHELHMVEGLSGALMRRIAEARLQSPATALVESAEAWRRINTPLLLKFAGRVNRFDGTTATKVLIAISRIQQSKLNPLPEGIGRLSPQVLSQYVNGISEQARRVRQDAREARQALRAYVPQGIVLPELTELAD